MMSIPKKIAVMTKGVVTQKTQKNALCNLDQTLHTRNGISAADANSLTVTKTSNNNANMLMSVAATLACTFII